MSPRTIRDVDALELGFLADGVLQAISAAAKGGAGAKDLSRLKQGQELLTGIADSVGPATATGDRQFQFATMNSFQYAADALRSVTVPNLSQGLRSYFATQADVLGRLIDQSEVQPEEVDSVRNFFKALSAATLESWNAVQGPTLLGTERLSWLVY